MTRGTRTGRSRALRQSASLAVRKTWDRVRNGAIDGHKFRREHQIGRFYADFACERLRLVIEIDGGIHRLDDVALNDHLRQQALEALGWTVVRFENDAVLHTPWLLDDAIRKHAREMAMD